MDREHQSENRKRELLASLLVERYDNRWWKTPDEPTPDERVRREAVLLDAAFEEEEEAG